MENNGINPNTGSKGVFPGSNQAVGNGGVNTSGVQNQELNQNQDLSKINQPVFSEQNIAEFNPENTKTYIRLETKNTDGQISGVLEIDLISFRERGQESRYLSINTIGSGSDGGQSDTTISIGNETDFNQFKKFISELNWND